MKVLKRTTTTIVEEVLDPSTDPDHEPQPESSAEPALPLGEATPYVSTPTPPSPTTAPALAEGDQEPSDEPQTPDRHDAADREFEADCYCVPRGSRRRSR